MERLGLSYYAGLLSAAEYHGAAHHRPQEFQVFVEKQRRPLVCGKVRVRFLVRKRLRAVAVQRFNTPRGTVIVSTPEATALDLVGHQQQAGGLDAVATMLSELAEAISPDRLLAAAAAAPIAWVQRLGYLLERVGAADKAEGINAYVRQHANVSVPLLLKAPHRKADRNADWKLYINAEVEAEA